jgi:hypothetical protein
MSGSKPRHKLEVLQEGENPVDLTVANTGEADEDLDAVVTATWNHNALVASDALAGWTVDPRSGSAVFSVTSEYRSSLPPGGKRKIGWLRYDQATNPRVEIARKR